MIMTMSLSMLPVQFNPAVASAAQTKKVTVKKTEITVNSNKGIKSALKNKAVSKIILNAASVKNLNVPKGNYKDKTLVINLSEKSKIHIAKGARVKKIVLVGTVKNASLVIDEAGNKVEIASKTTLPEVNETKVIDLKKSGMIELGFAKYAVVTFKNGYSPDNTDVYVDGVKVNEELTQVDKEGTIYKWEVTSPNHAELKVVSGDITETRKFKTDVPEGVKPEIKGEKHRTPAYIIGHAPVASWDYYPSVYDDEGNIRKTVKTTLLNSKISDTRKLTERKYYADEAVYAEDGKKFYEWNDYNDSVNTARTEGKYLTFTDYVNSGKAKEINRVATVKEVLEDNLLGEIKTESAEPQAEIKEGITGLVKDSTTGNWKLYFKTEQKFADYPDTSMVFWVGNTKLMEGNQIKYDREK